jgi:hypothetical protein
MKSRDKIYVGIKSTNAALKNMQILQLSFSWLRSKIGDQSEQWGNIIFAHLTLQRILKKYIDKP